MGSLAIALGVAAPSPASSYFGQNAGRSAPTMRPYCGMSFAINLSAEEEIRFEQREPVTAYIFTTGGRKFALAEGLGDELPVGSTVGTSHELPTARVTELRRDNRTLGYLFVQAERGVRTMLLGTDLKGFEEDKALLQRFNFGAERTCATILAPAYPRAPGVR